MEQIQDFEVGVDELWAAVSDPGLMDWLGDEVELDLRPGGEGRVVDDGEPRRLVVDQVDVGRRVSFHWWPEDDERLVSRVDLIVIPRSDGSRLVVRETLACSAGAVLAVGANRWMVRLLLLSIGPGAIPLVRA